MALGTIVHDRKVPKGYARDNTRSHDPIVDHARDIFGATMSTMHVIIGSDHAGYGLKEQVKDHLARSGHVVVDKGALSEASVDYPLFAHAVANAVAGQHNVLGIVICGSGNGVNISANRHKGVRSALCWLPEIATLARQHNDANVLALPARFLGVEEALSIVDAFLAAHFEGGRHQRRVELIDDAVATVEAGA